MKTYDIDDLQSMGFYHVTGESCGLGMRTLYGLNQQAWDTVKHFFGMPDAPNHPFLAAREHVSSIMLPYYFMPTLMIYWIFLNTDCERAILVNDQYVNGLNIKMRICAAEGPDDQEFKNKNESFYRLKWEFRNYYKGGDAINGTRNRHHWTGMVE